ncbi:MAG: RNA polymerase sigma factor RpoD/SigA [Patescibacteria group bacterium]|nr:RNA polymerase sigma factor RpoD/SigA [Patescibacteria group bacterium]
MDTDTDIVCTRNGSDSVQDPFVVSTADKRLLEQAEPSLADMAMLEAEERKMAEELEVDPGHNGEKDFAPGDFYFKEVKRHKLLSRSELNELHGQGMRGDQEAKERAIICNLRFVWTLAGKYRDRGLSRDDLIQEGTIGLMKAFQKFEPRKGYRFSTYAFWWIRQAMTRAIENQASQVRLPVHVQNLQKKIRSKAVELRQRLGRRPSVQEIAKSAGCTEEKVQEAFDGVGHAAFSFDQPNEYDDGEDGKRIDHFVSDSQASPIEEILKKEAIEESASQLASLLSALDSVPEKERRIFKQMYGLTEETARLYMTLEIVSSRVKLTRERVRQIIELVWRNLAKRFPDLKLSPETLSILRQDLGLFEKIWTEANAADRSTPIGAGRARKLIGLKAFKEWDAGRLLHVRASPAYANWRPMNNGRLQPQAESLIAFIAFAYELSEAAIRGSEKQSAETRWARLLTVFIMAEDLGMSLDSMRPFFALPYGAISASSHKEAARIMGTDPLMRQDVDGLRSHFRSFIKQ